MHAQNIFVFLSLSTLLFDVDLFLHMLSYFKVNFN